MRGAQWPAIPGYHIIDVAGKGGMGRVYRAEQEATGRIVALKMLAPAAVSAEALANFTREAETIARLEHPHVLPVYDFGQWQGVPFLVMRYLEQGSVADRLRQGPIDVERAARWSGQVAEALDWAHRQGVVHKDVKPGNMLLDSGDNVYLADFGIAAAANRGAGSAAYMAPEQARAEAVDGRADVYALAVSLFEMVTGQKPYAAATVTAALVRHQQDPVPSARDLNQAVSPALAELIHWGMAKSPDARPATVASFAGYLERALAAPEQPLRPDETTPDTVALSPAAPSGRRWPVTPGLILVALIVGLIAALVAVRPWRNSFPGPATPTARAIIAPVMTATLPPTPVGQLLFDDFADPGSAFDVFSSASGRVAYADGALRFTTLQPNILLVSPSGQVRAADVLARVEVVFVSGPATGQVGVICRWRDEDNYTALAFSADGTALIWQQRNRIQSVLQQTAAAELATAPAARRHLQVRCDGAALQLVVDGRLAVAAADPQPVSGDVVLMTFMPGEGELVVDFDDLVVRQPN